MHSIHIYLETGEPRKNHWPSVSHWQLDHIRLVLSTPLVSMYLITCMQDCNEYNPPCIWSHEIVFVYLIMYLIIWDWFEYTLLCSWSHEIILSTSHTMYLITWNLSEYTSPCTWLHKSTPHSVFDYMDCFEYRLFLITCYHLVHLTM